MRTPLRENYNATIYACYLGYITQAVVNNFAPLLFLIFARQFGLTLSQITIITTLKTGPAVADTIPMPNSRMALTVS